MRFRSHAIGAVTRRHLLLLGGAAFAARQAAAQPPEAPNLVLLPPVFPPRQAALLRALLSSPGLMGSLAASPGALIVRRHAGFGRDLAHARRVCAGFVALAGQGLAETERAAIEAAFPVTTAFDNEQIDFDEPTAISGVNLVDQLAAWLWQTVVTATMAPEDIYDNSYAPRATLVFEAMRAQVGRGFAREPGLMALDEGQRRELALWSKFNGHTQNDIARTSVPLPGETSPAPERYAALRQRCFETLWHFGLDPRSARVTEAGLQPRRR